MRRLLFPSLAALCLVCSAALTCAQLRLPWQKATPAPVQPMRKPSELIRRQEPLKVNQGLLKQLTPDQAHIVVSIPKQRAYLMLSDQIVADGPISSGKTGHGTP